MSTLGHIVAKDVRRLRWLLIVPLVLAVLRIWLLVSGQPMPGVELAQSAAFGGVALLLPFVEIIFFWLFVSFLAHEEPLVGSNAFWLTRPIDRRTMLVAKLTTACAVLVAFPVVVNTVLLAVWGAPASSLIAAAIQLALIRLAWVTIAFIVASLTPSPTAYIVATVGTLVALGAGIVITFTLLSVLSQSRGILLRTVPGPPIPDDTAWLTIYLGVAVTGVGVLLYQYSTRRRWITLATAALAVGACLLTLPRVPWRFARGVEPTPPGWVTALQPRLTGLSARPASLGALGQGEPGFMVSAEVDVTPMLRGFSAAVYAPETRLRPESGDPIVGTGGGPMMRLRTAELWPAVSSWYGLLESTPVANPWNNLASEVSPILMYTTTSDHGRLTSSVLAFDGTLDLRLTEHRVAGVLALAEGGSVRMDDYLLEITNVQLRPSGCALVVRESHFPRMRPISRPTLAVVLRNTTQGSSLVGSANAQSPPIPISAFAVLLSKDATIRPSAYMWVSNWTATYSSTFASGDLVAPLALDDAWLKEADVVVIESRYAGQVLKPWSAEGLRLSSAETSR